ncbi:MAG: branched-chain amino acid ABC transporter permease [Alphaproteobacteria bacterium]
MTAALVRGLLVFLFVTLIAPPTQADDLAEPIRRCVELLPGLRESEAPARVETVGGGRDERTGVQLAWTEPGFAGRPRADWLVCWFYPLSETGDWQFIQVHGSRYGVLGRYDIQQLYKFLRVHEPDPSIPEARRGWRREVAYLAQQAVNAASLGCVYALIAVAFTLVWGVTRVINLAFGEFVMIGAYVTLLMTAALAQLGLRGLLIGTLVALPVAVATIAALGFAAHRVVFRPLGRAPGQVALIAAIGTSIALKEAVRLLQGPRTRWMPPNSDGLALFGVDDFTVFLSRGHVVIGIGTGVIACAFAWVALRSGFGRGLRAIAQDPGAAALVGVDVERGMAAAQVVAAGLAGAAGVFSATQYGLIDPFMGTTIGFKALAAAILGGIGSLPGAIAGAFIIAGAEVASAATIGSAWKDTAAFAALVGILVLRPRGLFGHAEWERV